MNRWTGSRLAVATAVAALGVALAGSSASAISLLTKMHVPAGPTFDTQVELQAMYDEISETYGPGMTANDFNMFDDVVYTSDWTFVDQSGRHLTLSQVNERDAKSPEPDSVIERIEKLSVAAGGVTTLVTSISVHSFVDTAGRYGRAGASHTMSEITPYRDQWVRTTGGWKMRMRTQVGSTRTVIDKPEFDM